MIFTVMKKEIQENLLSFRFSVTLLLCVILIPLGVYVNIEENKKSRTDFQESQRLYQESIEGMRNAQNIEARGLRPPSPFGVFANGLDAFLPDEVISTRHEGVQMDSNRTLDDPLSLLFGKMDFLFVAGVVLSLLAILFTFDSITREKEQGTLRLSLSNPVPRHHLLIGKYLGNFITFLIPFILAFLIGVIILVLSGILPLFQAGNLLRLLSILGIVLIFLSVFFNLGLMVSTLCRRSFIAQIILLFIWVLFVFVVPRVSGMVAGILKPVKTQQTVQLEKSLIRKNIRDEKAASLKEIFLRSQDYRDSDSYDRFRDPVVKALREKELQQLRAVEADYNAKKRSQRRLAVLFSRLSPVASLTFSVTELCQTGLHSMDHLNELALEFHREASETIHSRGYKDEIPGAGMRMRMGWVKSEEIPRFQYNRTGLAAGIQSSWVDILILMLYNFLFFSVAYVGFLRYDVR
jgi:ABC-type transport system involved in multi-copper enzyme maturation permease subunit